VTSFSPAIGPPREQTLLDIQDLSGGLLLRATNHLGDAVMTLPAAWRLKQQLPAGAPLAVLTPHKWRELWQAAAWVDRVITFPGRRLDPAARADVADFAADATVILPNSFGSACDLARAGSQRRLGRGGRMRALLLQHRLPAWRRVAGADEHHEVCKYLEIAAACGVRNWGVDYPPLHSAVPIPAECPTGGPLLAIAPGAAYGPAKQWPTEHFCAIVAAWEGPVVALGAPGEEAVAESAIANSANAVNLAGRTSLSELMAILQVSDCIVANDSGTMHLGAALGRSGVAIFGSTDPLATGPIGGNWIVMQEPVPCAPCLARTCKRETDAYECLLGITPDAVLAAIATLRDH
jgi:heptosyltransferase-2